MATLILMVLALWTIPAAAGQASARLTVRVKVLTAATVALTPKSASVRTDASGRITQYHNRLKIRALGAISYILRFEIVDTAVAFADIDVGNAHVHLTSGAAEIPVSPSTPERSIEYRVQYRDGISPTGRSEPLRISYIP